MPDKSIFALPDIHSDAAARLKAQDLLSDGQIKVFYIEWAKPIEPDNLGRTFADLAPGDAKPTLRDLTALAISKGIPVVPCDLAPEEVLKSLDKKSPDYAPHGQHSLYQPWGQAVRDEHAAKVIAEDIRGRGNGTVALLMYGSDHFKPRMDEGVMLSPPLDTLIRAAKTADVYMLKPTLGPAQSSEPAQPETADKNQPSHRRM